MDKSLTESDREMSAAVQIVSVKSDLHPVFKHLYDSTSKNSRKTSVDGVPIVSAIKHQAEKLLGRKLVHGVDYVNTTNHPHYDRYREVFRESTELEEMSKEKLKDYEKKASADLWKKMKQGDKAGAVKRANGIHTAMKKEVSEEQIFEASLVHIMRHPETGAKAHVWQKSEGGYHYEVESTHGSKRTYHLPLSKVIKHLKAIGWNEVNMAEEVDLNESNLDNRGAYKVGTKVTVDGKNGEISYVHHSNDHPTYPHSYKVTDLDANDEYKQKRLENGNRISHSRIKLA